MAGRADLERALRGGGRSRCACLAGRHHVAERWILGTRRRLFEVRLAHHRHRVGPRREPGPLGPKSCYSCWMVKLTRAQGRNMANPILVTGAAGRGGAVVGTGTELLVKLSQTRPAVVA